MTGLSCSKVDKYITTSYSVRSILAVMEGSEMKRVVTRTFSAPPMLRKMNNNKTLQKSLSQVSRVNWPEVWGEASLFCLENAKDNVEHPYHLASGYINVDGISVELPGSFTESEMDVLRKTWFNRRHAVDLHETQKLKMLLTRIYMNKPNIC